jgi:hypothetical protein
LATHWKRCRLWQVGVEPARRVESAEWGPRRLQRCGMGLGQIPGYMPGISFEVVTLSNCTVNSSTSVRFDSSPRQQCRIGFVSGNEPPLEARTSCGDSIHGGVAYLARRCGGGTHEADGRRSVTGKKAAGFHLRGKSR